MIALRPLVSASLLCALLSGCCSLPTWLLGNIRYDAPVPNDLIDPENVTTYTLCATDATGTKGIVEMKKGELDEALVLFKRASEGSEQDANAHFNYGVAAELSEDYQTALECYDKASKLSTSQTYIDCYKRAKSKVNK